jgi:hypothetical protein
MQRNKIKAKREPKEYLPYILSFSEGDMGGGISFQGTLDIVFRGPLLYLTVFYV